MARKITTLATAFGMVALAATAAQAHPDPGQASGFIHGFSHPFSGMDHIMAMVAVGLLAARLGGRALWLVPLSFIAMMAVGGLLGITGVGLPLVETGIALSVIVLGALVALDVKLPTALAMGIAGFFALFHGHAHGAEMPLAVSGLSFGLGFVAATALLHGAGIGLGAGIARALAHSSRPITRLGGAAMALAGLGLLGGYL